jgi:short subunit dehydrogenase-like uncharacterized protein
MQFLLYGANGYTAQLMIPLAANYGLTPILAGRSAEKLAPLAEQYGLTYRAFDLNAPQAVRDGLSDVKAVLHCAGPFMHTSKPMLTACLELGVHYLDITGEVSVFEYAHSQHEAALKAGITVLPGVGFDVVPTDCMAKHLSELMPDATHLRLAFSSEGGGLTHGTALTMASTAGEGGFVRRNGKITSVPLGHWGGMIQFGDTERFCMAIPWGDVSTAYHTTKIPNIEVYTNSTPASHKALRWQWAYNWLLRTRWMRQRLADKIKKRPAGPSESRRQRAKMLVWGEVRNAAGQTLSAYYTVPEGYSLTAHTALLITSKILAGQGKPGFWTPAGLFGKDIIREVKGLTIDSIL